MVVNVRASLQSGGFILWRSCLDSYHSGGLTAIQWFGYLFFFLSIVILKWSLSLDGWNWISLPFTSGSVSRNCTSGGWSRPFPLYHIACSVDDDIPEVRLQAESAEVRVKIRSSRNKETTRLTIRNHLAKQADIEEERSPSCFKWSLSKCSCSLSDCDEVNILHSSLPREALLVYCFLRVEKTIWSNIHHVKILLKGCEWMDSHLWCLRENCLWCYTEDLLSWVDVFYKARL